MDTRSKDDANLKRTRSGATWGDEPPHKKARSSGDPLYMRVDTRSDIKVSFTLDQDEILLPDGVDKSQLSPEMRKSLSRISHVRPLAFSPNKTTMFTPDGKTRMFPKLNLCSMTLFSSEQDSPTKRIKPIAEGKINPKFYETEEYKAVQEPKSSVKAKEVKITRKLLQETADAYEAQDGRRLTSQTKAVVKPGVNHKLARAKLYMQKAFEGETIPEIEWSELAHLIAYSVLGEESQEAENLVYTTRNVNTQHELINRNLTILAEKYPKGFTLKASSTLVGKTNIAHKMKFEIVTPDFTVPFEFDASVSHKPHIAYWDIMRAFIEQLVRLSRPVSKLTFGV